MQSEREHRLPAALLHGEVAAQKARLDEIADENLELRLDATGVTRIDDSGLQFLLACLTRLVPVHLRAISLRPNHYIHERLRQTGLDLHRVDAPVDTPGSGVDDSR